MIPNFLDVVKRAWQDFDFALPGCESSRDAQRRAVAVIGQLARMADRETIVVSSHGNLIGLLLNHVDARFGFKQWRAMPFPAVYLVSGQAKTIGATLHLEDF